MIDANQSCNLVRKGGFEPPRLSAPPPQDGVSASSTTSAQGQNLTAQQQFIIAKRNPHSAPSMSPSEPCGENTSPAHQPAGRKSRLTWHANVSSLSPYGGGK